MQTVAQGWLVLQLTDSAFAVGLVTALGSLPILLFTLYGGVVADRVDKRRLVLVLQSLMLLEALALAVLTHQGWITVHLVMALAAFYGLLSAFEVPTRQALVSEIVGREDLMNAIALNSSAFNVARVIGPSIAGALIATVGLAACFYLNAASYLAVIVGLLLMRVRRPAIPSTAPAFGALKEGFGYIFGNRWPRALVTIIAGVQRLRLLLPADDAGVRPRRAGPRRRRLRRHGLGHRPRRGRRRDRHGGERRADPAADGCVIGSFALFGVLLAAAAFAPGFWSALVLFTGAGCLMAMNGILANTMLQLQAPDRLRGRVMGFYSFVVLGMAPFGAFQAGWVVRALRRAGVVRAGRSGCVLMAAWWGGRWRSADGGRRNGSGRAIAGRLPARASSPCHESTGCIALIRRRHRPPSPLSAAHAHHHLPRVRRGRLRGRGAGGAGARLARGGQRAGGAGGRAGGAGAGGRGASGRSGSRRSSSGWRGRWSPPTPELVVPPEAGGTASSLSEEDLVRVTELVVEEVAAEGRVVLVGRAAPAVLARERDAIHVKVVAPREWRVRAAAERLGMSPAEAAKVTDETDKMRARYHRQHYERDWNDPAQLSHGAEHGRAGPGRRGGGGGGAGAGVGVVTGAEGRSGGRVSP